MSSSSFDKLELLTAKEDYNRVADELDELYTALLTSANRFQRIRQLYDTKQQECNRLYERMITLENKYHQDHGKNKHIEFVNTPIISGGSIDAIWRREYRASKPSLVRDEVLDDWPEVEEDQQGYEDEDQPELTREDFATEWEYKTYLALKT